MSISPRSRDEPVNLIPISPWSLGEETKEDPKGPWGLRDPWGPEGHMKVHGGPKGSRGPSGVVIKIYDNSIKIYDNIIKIYYNIIKNMIIL